MKWLQKGSLPPKVREQMISRIGSYQAEKLTATLLNGTLAQKIEIIRDLKLKDNLRVCYNCGKLIDEGFVDEDANISYCSRECAVENMNYVCSSVFYTTWKAK